ncbi:uncharacterized protein LOC130962854 [Arachis stenosperma]|uniref:uncharacterized protein LOC130962854 n=1 Tax=Arachis stenosperma TaxID=217475 RepID=UPI0025AD56D8|nr:uncharacterized protein LOC130962854 [Arachis stenosperma]
MDMSKDWMDTPHHEKEYQVGVERFLHFAFSSKGVPQGEEIQCPCAKCCNIFWLKRDDVYDHLIYHGFVKGYRRWFNHGESLFAMDIDSDIGGEYNCNDNIDELLRDRFRDNTQVDGQNMGPNECAKEFYKLVDEASQELYPGCKGFTRLSFTIRLYLLKCLHGLSNASFTSLLKLLKKAMPYLNIPISFDKTKNMVKNLGLDYQNIDACRNDCMLYRNGYENDSSCHVCGTSRYIEHHEEEDDVTLSRKPHKVAEPRNVRLGLASYGFNPFQTLSSTHSTWPVVLMVYNLPPWMSMKPDYFMLSLLISGPQSPRNDIDIYLQPLIKELKELWESGVETYDSKENKTFNMRACLLWTINDFPAYAMLSGWSTKGKLACPCCNDETSSIYLKNSHKTVYMDHRRFLPMNHPWRHNKRSFNGKTELMSPPQLLEGSAVFDILREKNIVDSIIGTLLDIPEKTKDHAAARFDLKDMDGSASNIARCVHETEKKISGYKTHDAHFMLHYLLQVPIKSILPDHVAIALVRLCSFFRRICQKVISLDEVVNLEAEIAETLCQLERIFPPSFFDIMVHLPIHLANKVRLGGPVQYRWMYPVERYMCTLKSYVRNRSRPEGSIAEGYLANECINFCSRYLHEDVHTRFNRIPRNNDECVSDEVQTPSLFPCKGCPLGGRMGNLFILDEKSEIQGHAYILNNCDKIEVYMREHEEAVNDNNLQRTKWEKTKDRSQQFSEWFKIRAMKKDVPSWAKGLARGPNRVAKRFSGYIINGYRFHTRHRDARRKTQNSGVTLEALTPSFASVKDKNPIEAKVSYYGRIVDTFELDYYGQFKVVLFKCEWYTVAKDNFGLSYVYFNKKCYQEEPFVLASQVNQCFYVQDPYVNDKHYVMKTIPRDLFRVSDDLESDSPIIYAREPCEPEVIPSLPNDNGKIDLVRNDLRATIIDMDLNMFAKQYCEEDEEIEYEYIEDFDSKTS